MNTKKTKEIIAQLETVSKEIDTIETDAEGFADTMCVLSARKHVRSAIDSLEQL